MPRRSYHSTVTGVLARHGSRGYGNRSEPTGTPMAQTDVQVQHPIIAIIVALAIVGGIGYGIYYHFVISPRTGAAVEEKLLAPYFALIGEGKLDEAWQRYTSDRYKKNWPLEKFRDFHRQSLAERGAVTRRNLFAAQRQYTAYQVAVSEKNSNPSGKWISVRYQLTFERGFELIQYQVV